MIETSKQVGVRTLAAVALALAACNSDAAGQIPCAEDISCPSDYPVCGPAGKCIAGTSTATASVAIVGADGHAASDFLSGTVRVLVSARASTGVRSVALTAGSTNFAASATAAAPPLYAFDVDTTQLADGDRTLTATLTAGDGSTGTATGTLHVDNAKPVITTFTVDGAASTVITSGTSATISATFTGAAATVTASSGGSLSLSSGASVLVSPDVATTYKLTVTSRSGVSVQTGTTGPKPDVSVGVVSPASFTGTASVSPSTIVQGPGSGSFTFTAPVYSGSVVSAVVKDGAGTTLGTFASPGGTVLVPVPATAPGTTQLAYTVVLSNGATNPHTISLPLPVTVVAPAQVLSFTAGTTLAASSGTATISSNGTTKLFAAFAGGGAVGTLSCAPSCNGTLGSTSISSGGNVTVTGSTNGALTYTLTVTPSFGPVATATAVVNVVPQATATSLIAGSAVIHQGGSTTLTPMFSFNGAVLPGTATITGTDLSTYAGLTSGTPIQIAPTVPTVTYTLHVANAAGTAAAALPTVTVSVGPGTWSAFNTNTSDVRQGATVTALDSASGKVLIAGGMDGGNPLDTARLCDATGACASITMGSKRAYHTAVRITAGSHAGQILLAGGFTATGPPALTATAQYFDPVTGTFLLPMTSISVARARHVAVLLGDGKTVLIAGGTDGTNNLLTAIKYNSDTDTAANSGNMAQARASFTGTLLGTAPASKVLIVGGKIGDVSAELFDTTGNSNVGTFANTSTSLPASEDKRFHTAVVIEGLDLGGQVLISGGTTTLAGNKASATQFLYNPAADTFTSVAALANARTNQAAIALVTHDILVCGGLDVAAATMKSCELFRPSTGTMLPTAPMLEARADFGLASITVGSMVEVLAAGSLVIPMKFAELYDTN